jgi:hypothetical protein
MLAQIGSDWPVVAAGGKTFGIQMRGLVEHASKKEAPENGSLSLSVYAKAVVSTR